MEKLQAMSTVSAMFAFFIDLLSALTSCPFPLKWTFSNSVRRAGSPFSEVSLNKM